MGIKGTYLVEGLSETEMQELDAFLMMTLVSLWTKKIKDP